MHGLENVKFVNMSLLLSNRPRSIWYESTARQFCLSWSSEF